MTTQVMILKIVLAISFGVIGILTLFGLKPVTQLFVEFKLNRFAMILAGLIELILVFLLFNLALDFYAAIGLAYLTTAAIYKHIKARHFFKSYIPSILLLILSVYLALLLMSPI